MSYPNLVNVLLISIYSDIRSSGIRSISGYLKKYGKSECKVTCLFLPQEIEELLKSKNKNKILNFIRENKFDIIGFSVMSNYVNKTRILTKEIKKVTKSVIIWGGIHPTVLPEECLKYCDYVCIGEGEEVFLKLIKAIKAGQTYKDIKNLGFKIRNKTVLTDICIPIQNLDDIPVVDYDVDTNFIFLDGKIQKMGGAILKQFMGNNLSVITSRGCAFSCSYCCNSALGKVSKEYKMIRRQHPNKIIDDLDYLIKKLKFIEQITFDDDDFLSVNIEDLILFSKLYKEKIRLPFHVTGITASTLTEEKLGILIAAGLKNVRLGIQSGSEQINYNIYNRYVPLTKIKEAIKLINKFKKKIKLPRFDIILDNPWETKDDKIKTIKFLNGLPRPLVINKFSLTFYPGTELFNRAIRENKIKSIEEEVYKKKFTRVENTFPNLLIYLISIIKLPEPVLDLLLKKYYTKKISYKVFKILEFIDILKRNLYLLLRFKLKAFLATMNYSLKLR